MATIDLFITLDRDPPEYRGGETVEGAVEMRVQESCECRALTVRVGWRAKSRYESDEGLLPELKLEGGTFQPGERRVHRFALELPPPVWTYQGQTFALEYAVRAKADLVNKADAHVETPLLVRPAENIAAEAIAPTLGVIAQPVDGPVQPLAAQRSIVIDQVTGTFQSGCLLLFGFFSLLAAIPFIGGSALLIRSFLPMAWEIGPLAVIPALLWIVLGVGIPIVTGFVLVYVGARPYLARWLIGEVTVDIPERLVAPGDTLSCRMSFQPKREVDIQNVTASIRARETIWRRTRNSRKSRHQTILTEERLIEGARHVRANDYVELHTRLDIPPHAPYSLGAPNHWVTWHAVIHINIRGWIDHTCEHLVTVAPIRSSQQT